MDQETYNGIIRVLERGAGVMAREYCQAFTSVVAELQRRIKQEEDEAVAEPEAPQKPTKREK